MVQQGWLLHNLNLFQPINNNELKSRFTMVMVCFLLLSGCQLENNERIESFIVENLSSQSEIDFSEIDWFEWDKLIIVSPYTDLKTLSKGIGVDFGNIENHAIQNVDFYNLLVFVNKEKSVEICESKNLFSPQNKLLHKEELSFSRQRDGTLLLTTK